MLAIARSSLRPVALIQAGLFACALLGAWGHRAMVRHGFCSDHGDAIHLEGVAPTRRPATGDSVGLDHHAHGAHNCVMLAFLSSSASTHGSITASPGQLVSTELPSPRADAGATRSIPLLLQAPKSSPPPA